ncbi:GNAT family N-acetyltransferase [Sphaerisporangium sp. NPDC051017]|uniref:GNAT family N-acetyltransferase n=1 Tax=Sphaerisporangium sp. NPDC051017 TaxID=3154636 RepID=UPI0034173AB8
MTQPIDEECDVLLRDGGIAHIRPLCASDREDLHALVSRSSERSAYLRFFAGGAATAHAYMDRLTGGAYRGHAVVALIDGRVVGVAEYIPDPRARDADIGILLDDQAQGRGLGMLLLERIALDAAESGVQELVAVVLAENRQMLQVIDDLGLPVRRRSDQSEIEVRLTPGTDAALLRRIDTRMHEAERASLARVLNPGSIAVVGAGRDPGGIGHRVLRNLIDGRFPGPVYPVNPRAREVCHTPAYPDLAAVPTHVDLVVVATPADTVLDVARDCARHGVHGLVVVSAGFAEAGEASLERRLLRICRDAGMRLVGPNCLGIVNTAASLNASFLPDSPPAGPLGLMSQSGAVAVAMIERAGELGLGISSFASVGDKADVSGNDLLEYWEDDDATRVIGMYLESFGNPRRFGRIARRISATKPIIVVNTGHSASGDRTVRSRTAAAATPDVCVDALLRASGVIRETGVQGMLDTARLLSFQPLPSGRRVAIVGNSGGPDAMTADACEQRGLSVPELSPATQAALRSRLRAAAVRNPVELSTDGDAGEFTSAIEIVLADPAVDALLVVYTPPFGSGLAATGKAVATAAAGRGRTVVACVMGHDGLIEGEVPCYAFPEQAVHALAQAADHAAWRARPTPPEDTIRVDVQAAREIVRKDLRAHPGGRRLDTIAAAALLSSYGVQVADSVSADGPETATEAAAWVGLPAVLKARGPDLVHKTEAGGVRLDLRTPEEVRQAYREMAGRLGPAMTGAVVQHMAKDGIEMIIGGVAHETFGPLVMVALGGFTTELLADRAFGVPPIDRAEAARMIGELRCAPLFSGYRGRPPANAASLADQIVRVGRLMDDRPEIAEIDLDPVIVTSAGAVAVDARIRLAPAAPRPSPCRRRLR